MKSCFRKSPYTYVSPGIDSLPLDLGLGTSCKHVLGSREGCAVAGPCALYLSGPSHVEITIAGVTRELRVVPCCPGHKGMPSYLVMSPVVKLSQKYAGHWASFWGGRSMFWNRHGDGCTDLWMHILGG